MQRHQQTIHGWGWRKLRDRVVREERQCRLRLPGCTSVSTTADHIIPRSQRPDLLMVRSNLRGSCQNCNLQRGDRPLEQVRAGHAKPRPGALDWFGDVPA